MEQIQNNDHELRLKFHLELAKSLIEDDDDQDDENTNNNNLQNPNNNQQ